ncbi:hypothetical protein ACPCYX_15200 [Pseudomonas fluorescens]|uniref:hypothetical protein n=1 Tax=Pseudomonas fluorescens TaxID=294 RepID=UPI003C1F6639
MSEKSTCMYLKLQGSSTQDGIGEEDISSDFTQPEIKCNKTSAQDHWAAFHQAAINSGAIKNSLEAPR